jgi:hypothetical protein
MHFRSLTITKFRTTDMFYQHPNWMPQQLHTSPCLMALLTANLFHFGILAASLSKGRPRLADDACNSDLDHCAAGVVMLGSLSGHVHAGCNGDRSAQISALELRGAQLVIAHSTSLGAARVRRLCFELHACESVRQQQAIGHSGANTMVCW